MDIKENILKTIGNTPIVKLNKISKGYKPQIFLKLEFFNPGGSVKDRIGIEIIEDAERDGRLRPGGTIVEATSGNTGVGLALAAAVKNYKCIFTIPDKMSNEKVQLLRAFGAEVIITPTAVAHESPESYTEVAKRIVRETPNSILANQFYNQKNPEAHYKTTGPEIWEQTDGQIDYFVAGVGTGGTISGVGKYLKEKNPKIKNIVADPTGSILRDFLETKKNPDTFKPYKVEGIGLDWIPGTLHLDYVDEVIEVTDKEAFTIGRRLAREEGIFSGGSSGTALAAALKIAERLNEKQIIVVLIPDTGERYLSKMYNDNWMREHSFLIPEKVTMRYVIQGKAKNLPHLISVDSSATVQHAFDLIKQFDISQIPVIDKGKSVGSIDDGDLMSAVLENSTLLDKPVSQIMKPTYPIIGIEAPIEHAVELLTKKNSAVIIEENKKIAGIVTRYDVIEYMSR
ncbi:MAG: cystathionine beta-synthase [Bacteroidota bacterium]|nr:cystathionine beta-synthase [Bacteroidota bacterium]